MSAEWVDLGSASAIISDETRGGLKAVLRCRRVVAVRFDRLGNLHFYARVPIPRTARLASPSLEESENNG